MLKPGDTIYWDYTSWYMILAKLIRWVTGGSAHVAKVIDVEPTRGIEVLEMRMIGGVCKTFIPAGLLHSTKHKKITVMSAKRAFTRGDLQKIQEYYMDLTNFRRKYGFLNMIREWHMIDKLFRFFGIKRDREMFCSSLVHELNHLIRFYGCEYDGDFYPNPAELKKLERYYGFVEWKI